MPVYEAIASNNLAICAGATSTLHCCRKARNGCANLCKSAHSCGWAAKYTRIEFSASPGGTAPALVTTLFASGWLARYSPVSEATEPRALLNPAAVHWNWAEAIGNAIVTAASVPSPLAASTLTALRLLMPTVCISTPSIAATCHLPTPWVSSQIASSNTERRKRLITHIALGSTIVTERADSYAGVRNQRLADSSSPDRRVRPPRVGTRHP